MIFYAIFYRHGRNLHYVDIIMAAESFVYNVCGGIKGREILRVDEQHVTINFNQYMAAVCFCLFSYDYMLLCSRYFLCRRKTVLFSRETA